MSGQHRYDTKAVHLGYRPDASTNYAISPSISMSSSYQQDTPATHRGYRYSRMNNPSRERLETALAVLEGSKYAVAYSAGISAISAVIQLVGHGEHIVSNNIIYGGTWRYFESIISRANVTTTYVDGTNPANVEAAIKPNTKLVYLESATNPLLTVSDIAEIARIVRRHPGIVIAVDNTFLTPYFIKPLELGAHLSIYSLTKYMNGHDDVCMGAICCNDEDLYHKVQYLQSNAGLNPSPFDCYIVHRSLKTLPLRMRQHMKNALEVAKFLEAQPHVEKVYHPWLPSHPQHTVAKKQSSGHSGMVAFYVKGDLKKTSQFVQSLKLINLAGSLGGVGSNVEIPALLSHEQIPKEERQKLGMTDNLIRLSVGIEDSRDLIEDLDQAFKSTWS